MSGVLDVSPVGVALTLSQSVIEFSVGKNLPEILLQKNTHTKELQARMIRKEELLVENSWQSSNHDHKLELT